MAKSRRKGTLTRSDKRSPFARERKNNGSHVIDTAVRILLLNAPPVAGSQFQPLLKAI